MAAILRLIDMAGWNQTDQDINRLLALEPDGCFAACIEGWVVGTTTTTTYGTDLAWIGMVLVDPEYRRRGIATALMRAAIDFLNERRVTTVKLDATAAGHPLYKYFGFQPESRVERWMGQARTADHGLFPESVGIGNWDRIAAMDRAAFGADRSTLMRAMIADCGCPMLWVSRHGGVGGYALARVGRRAGYIGPVVATDLDMVHQAVETVSHGRGSFYIDVDPAVPGAVEVATALHLTRQREFVRMRLGRPIRHGPPHVFAIAGPEIG